jgi:hypothetical protein
MYPPMKSNRPTLPERFEQFLELKQVNELLETLLIAFEETQNEKVGLVIHQIQQIKERWYLQEEGWRREEIQELLENIDDFPHSIRTWMLYYRDKELE